MKKERYESELTASLRDRSSWRTLSVFLGFANIVLVFGILSVVGTERTIVVPAVTHKTFWLEDEKASQEYLEQMAVFFTGLMLDVSPSNADYQGKLFLEYTDPSAHGALQTQLKLSADKIKRENASKTFYPTEIETDTRTMRVVVHGEETLFIGKNVISQQVKAYRCTFRMRQGRVYVTEFVEVDKNAPFKTAAKVDDSLSGVSSSGS